MIFIKSTKENFKFNEIFRINRNMVEIENELDGMISLPSQSIALNISVKNTNTNSYLKKKINYVEEIQKLNFKYK